MTILRMTWLCMLLTLSSIASAAESNPATAARSFGYVVGDLITQRVPLSMEGKAFTPAELPRVGRVGISLWRRSATVDTDANGQRWLAMEYQLINSPESLAVWQLPALQLAGTSAAEGTLNVPPRPITVGRFTPAEPFAQPSLGAMRADQLPAPIALAPIDRRIQLAVGALLVTLLAWGGTLYWRHRSSFQRLPFTRAARDLRGLPDDSPDAWRRLQHALNSAAGQVIRPNNVDALISRLPWLRDERPALEKFCRDASELFFGGRMPSDAASVQQVARRLKQLEQRYAR